MSDTLVHYGTPRRSGRYPWGSGGEKTAAVERLTAQGLSEVEIAKGLGISTGELRNQKTLAKLEEKESQRLNVIRQKERGMSVAAISREFKIAPSTVRDLLQPDANAKWHIITAVADKLRETIAKFGFVDVGEGSEIFVNVSRPKFDNAVTLLKNDGYKIHKVYAEQLGTTGNKKTTVKVLGSPESTYKEALANSANIAIPNFHAKDTGAIDFVPSEINNFSSNRVLVKYKNNGGAEKDGLIELRSGVPELNLGGKAYAQVRIGVDGTHFMKGMAVLRDDLPEGVDIVYNTSKLDTGNKLDAMKPQESVGKVTKFGAIVKPNTFINDKGKEVDGVVYIVGENKPSIEGAWDEWNKNLASQVLSKQSPRLATKQLDISYQNAKAELDEIKSLTNPTVKSHLLMEFGDKMDRAAVDLKAAALPRQTTNIILPDPNMKPTDVYAPNYKNGEVVSLIRYPHGGVFEIPTLTVNNKYSEYKDIIGTAAKDAIAIHPDVAQKLSGADFDGDFVMVIPNKNKQLRTAPSLEELKNFEPMSYKIPKDKLFNEKTNPGGIKPMTPNQKQLKMGDVSNLITDMTIKGASESEIARAVKHSMVVIDAEKHELNYKQSYRDNGIAALKQKYQGSARSGAATLISRAGSQARVPQRHDHFTIDPITGEKIYAFTENTYINKKTGKITPYTTRTTKLAKAYEEGKSAYDLSSGTVIESVYAEHANKMHGLANQARLATLNEPETPYNRQARKTYANEVRSLDAKYREAVRAKPIQRKAQLVGNEIYKSISDANPDMSYADKRTHKGRSLVLARSRLNATKPPISITPREWEAIEMGAVSKTRLKGILKNADMDKVREYATPRQVRGQLSGAKATRAKTLLNAGYTTAEVASALGVPVSQIRKSELT